MQKITTATVLLMVSLFAFSQQKKADLSKSFSTKNKKITVYTTADSTKLRLTQTDILTFVPSKQPLEIEVSVFVEPTKTFQKFFGIGGAITDASAEVFAKLSKAGLLSNFARCSRPRVQAKIDAIGLVEVD